MADLKFYIQRNFPARGLDIHLFDYSKGRAQFARKQLADHPEGENTPPFATVDMATAQDLMDGLWEAGIRPTEGSGSAGSLAATQKHLQDMRSIVAHKLNIPMEGVKSEIRVNFQQEKKP